MSLILPKRLYGVTPVSWLEHGGQRPSSIVVPRYVFLRFTDRRLGFLGSELHSLGEFVDRL